MTSPSNRKVVNHLIKNTRYRNQNQEIILNTDEIEPKLDQIITAVAHTVMDISVSTVIIAGLTTTMAPVDISGSNGIFKFQFAGTLTHSNMSFAVEVSQNNVDWHPFPILFTTINNNVSSTYDMVYRYHRISVSNNTGGNHSINYIQSGRH